MSYFLALAAAGLMGICVAVEPIVNTGLGKYITNKMAVLHSFLLGGLVVAVLSIFSGGLKQYAGIVKAPPYLWIGGLLGATIVYLGTRVIPVIGAASMLTVMVVVQLIVGIIIDNFGLMGAQKIPVDAGRIVGVLLLIAAVRLILK